MNNIKQVFKTKVVTDLNIGYDFTDNISASFTVNNLFNVLTGMGIGIDRQFF